MINGTEVRPIRKCYVYLIYIFGLLLIFPCFLFCCNLWKRWVYPLYHIPKSTYVKLGRLFRSAKAKILYDYLAESRVRSFTFKNDAGDFNL
jgi:hypothetical protein